MCLYVSLYVFVCVMLVLFFLWVDRFCELSFVFVCFARSCCFLFCCVCPLFSSNFFLMVCVVCFGGCCCVCLFVGLVVFV